MAQKGKARRRLNSGGFATAPGHACFPKKTLRFWPKQRLSWHSGAAILTTWTALVLVGPRGSDRGVGWQSNGGVPR